MGAGGLRVALPSRSGRGRLLVAREPDPRYRPGIEQRRQLHVTAARKPTPISPGALSCHRPSMSSILFIL